MSSDTKLDNGKAEQLINNSTILQDDDCTFVNNSKYDIVIPAGTTVYYCPSCQKYFKSLEDFVNHRKGVCK